MKDQERKMSMGKPYLSILTATYNRGKLLERAYNSILENTKFEVEIEWLIMDDGSVDNTKDIVATFKENKYLKIRYYSKKNNGKMAAINDLVELATGDFILDLDSDDILNENAVKIIKENCFLIDDIYGFVFLKEDKTGKIMGKKFEETRNKYNNL